MSRNRMILTAAVLALVLIIGGILAYFSDYDNGDASFTTGSVKIKLSNNSIDLGDNILPRQTIDASGVKVKNVGSNSAYVFVEVVIPTITCTYEDEVSGTDVGTGISQIATIEGIGDGWIDVTGDIDSYGFYSNHIGHHVFAYAIEENSVNHMVPLASNTETNDLLKNLKIVNMREADPLDTNEDLTDGIQIYAYAIQSDYLFINDDDEDLTGIDTKLPANVWDKLMADRDWDDWDTFNLNDQLGIIKQD